MGGCGAGTKDKGEEEGVVWSFTREGNDGGGGMRYGVVGNVQGDWENGEV